MSLASLASNITVAQNPVQKAEQFYLRSQFDSSLRYLKISEFQFIGSGNDSMAYVIRNRIARILLLTDKSDSAFSLLKSNRQQITKRYGTENELISICNDLLGDWYMSVSDAETALTYYQKSYKNRIGLYKPGHPHISFSLANLARYRNFKIDIDSALYYAEKAYIHFNKNLPIDWDFPYERILLEHAYAVKIGMISSNRTNPKNLDPIRRLFFDAADYIKQKYNPHALQLVSVYRNIGNTYTDEVIYPVVSNSQRKLLFESALKYYDMGISIVSNIHSETSLEMSTLYYVKALVYDYSYRHDSLDQVINNHDTAIAVLIKEYRYNDIFSDSILLSCNYKYNLMTLITTKAFYYWRLYTASKQIEYLKKAYKLQKYAVSLWHFIIEEFENPYANRLMRIYNGKIFDMLIEWAWELHKYENNDQYLIDIFKYSELSKRSLQNKLLLNAGVPQIKSGSPSVIVPKDIQNKLPDDNTLYLDFFDSTMVMAISREKFIVKRINNLVKPDYLLATYQRAMKINDVRQYQDVTSKIYNTYLRPILDEVGFKQGDLIVSPDGIMSKISIAGLVTDTLTSATDFRKLSYAGLKYNIRYVLSGENLLNSQSVKNIDEVSFTGFVPEIKNHSSLPFSLKLVKEMQGKVAGTFYYGKDATASQFYSQSDKFGILHLASHAEADESVSANSRIYFSDNKHSNTITLDSLYRMNMSGCLAVLSACETNLGRKEYGEGTMNFARAFIYSGFKSTITTQWKVDDRSTASILKMFYNNLIDDIPLSSSLIIAQRTYLRECNTSIEANPIYWSGIILTGADGEISVKTDTSYYKWLVLSGLALVVIISTTIVYSKNNRHP